MPLDRSYWLADQIRFLKEEVARLASAPAIQNASSHGTTGWMRVFGKAVSDRPALEFHYTGGGGDLLAQVYQDTGGNLRITGGLQVSGTKNFVMQHPTETGWILRHASTESPVNGVEYWGESYIEPEGTVIVKLPRYFEALTKASNRNVQLTPIDHPAALAASRIVGGEFTVTGPPGAEFTWLVKAERASQPGDWPIDFLAEESGIVPPPPVPLVEEPEIDEETLAAIADAEAEGLAPVLLDPPPKPSSPMVELAWEKRPDRPPKPVRTDLEPAPNPVA